jgi:hypothetical protein
VRASGIRLCSDPLRAYSLTSGDRTLREPLRAPEDLSIARLGDVSASQGVCDRGNDLPPTLRIATSSAAISALISVGSWTVSPQIPWSGMWLTWRGMPRIGMTWRLVRSGLRTSTRAKKMAVERVSDDLHGQPGYVQHRLQPHPGIDAGVI